MQRDKEIVRVKVRVRKRARARARARVRVRVRESGMESVWMCERVSEG